MQPINVTPDQINGLCFPSSSEKKALYLSVNVVSTKINYQKYY